MFFARFRGGQHNKDHNMGERQSWIRPALSLIIDDDLIVNKFEKVLSTLKLVR